MPNEITEKDLAERSAAIVEALGDGESFVVTSGGRRVGTIEPLDRRQFVPKEDVMAAFRGVPRMSYRRLREDLDALIDQDPTPRA